MSALNFNLRNIPPSLMILLKKEAEKQKVSVNSLILKILEKRLGIVKKPKKTIYNDLDYLAETCNKIILEKNTEFFEKIE